MPAGLADPRGYNWIEIDDFSPGIINNTGFTSSFTGGATSPPGSKLGQAQGGPTPGSQTYGCIALPNGGLGPGPGIPALTPWGATNPVAPQHSLASGAANNMIVGLFCAGPLKHFGSSGSGYPLTLGDELIIGQIANPGAGSMAMYIDSLQINGSSVSVNNVASFITGTLRQPFATMTGGITRANSSSTSPGYPCWVLSWYFPGGTAGLPLPSAAWGVLVYPDPTALGIGFSPHYLYDDTGAPGDAFVHQNRMGWLQDAAFTYSSTSTYFGGNEEFYYTDPPNGLTVISTPEVFVQEDPSGYGAWGSQSASELFLVKHKAGGVVISGDLNVPTVTVLPGVTPTYGLVSRGASTPIGFVYASNNRGLWAWNGGNTSQKISAQLEDNFMQNPYMPAVSRGPTVDICRWGDWIICTNDWLYDTVTGGWWKLAPSANTSPSRSHHWYATSSDGNTLYACLAEPQTSNGLECYSRLAPTDYFQWLSYPMRPPTDTKNRSMNIREVVVRAQGVGTVTIIVTGYQGANSTSTSSPSDTLTFELGSDASQPRMQRIALGMPAQDITVQIESQGYTATAPAPIVYSVAIGYEEVDALVSAT
jgi:hypothetical protein